ncbi:MAG: GNAT family N-acetyltransferase [Chloroflexales bacterium]|nr:GNAT family N-acetyltransferase [Chloroflexales bacterium]
MSLRPAQQDDIEALAALLVQLYASEAPGMLRGSLAGQQGLLRYILEADEAVELRNRYVACDKFGTVVATAGLRWFSDESLGAMPPGTVEAAVAKLGAINTLFFCAAMVRSALIPETLLPTDSVYIYSVVVDENVRGQGIGAAMMLGVEDLARQQGAQAALLRVLVDNQDARAFYVRLGYTIIDRSPRWLDWLTFPSELMCKDL